MKSISSEKGSKLTVAFQVVKSEPAICLSSSHEPEACKSYANKTYDIRLSKSFKDKLKIGSKFELVQEGIHGAKGALRKAWSLPEDCV